MGGDAIHQIVRVKADDDEPPIGFGDSGGLAVEGRECRKMLVGKRLDRQVVGFRWQTCVEYIASKELSIDTFFSGQGQHLGGEVYAVNLLRALLPEPHAYTTRAAREVYDAAKLCPVNGLDSRKEANIHLVLNGLLVVGYPLAVAFLDRERVIAALVEAGEVHSVYSTAR